MGQSVRTVREELADVVRRAVREGDLTLAMRLLDATRVTEPGQPRDAHANVIELATRRARRALADLQAEPSMPAPVPKSG